MAVESDRPKSNSRPPAPVAGVSPARYEPLKAQCPREYNAVAGTYVQGWIGTHACSGKSVILGVPSKGYSLNDCLISI